MCVTCQMAQRLRHYPLHAENLVVSGVNFIHSGSEMDGEIEQNTGRQLLNVIHFDGYSCENELN